MKIGYVLKYFPKLSETFVLHEMVALERVGAELEVFAFAPSGGAPLASALGGLAAPVHYLDHMPEGELLSAVSEQWAHIGHPHSIPDLLAQIRSERGSLKLLRRTAELVIHIRTRDIQHLHAHFAGPAAQVAHLAAQLTGISYTFTCHAKDIYHESVVPSHFRRLASGARAVITVCEANRRYILEHLDPGLGTKIQVLYNGVDLERFNPRHRKVESGVPLVLGVGRLVAKKGFVHLVEAIALLERYGHPVDCVIVGEGRERASLEARIESLGVEGVRLIGAARHDEVQALLEHASVLALPCVVDPEGNRDALPTVLLEALASGVPVVSTPVTGVGEIIEDGMTGILVPEADSEALAGALVCILQAPERASRMAAAGRQRAEARFDLYRNGERLLDLMGPARPALVGVR